MIQKIKRNLFSVVATLMIAAPLAVPAMASGLTSCNTNIANGVSAGATGAAGGNTPIDCSGTGSANDATSTITDLAKTVVNIFSVLVGATAVIMVIYGGFRYITSGGDSGRVGAAKNSLIYAIVGLFIVAIAQLLVHFVLTQANTIR